MTKQTVVKEEQMIALAKARNLPISTKHSVEISNCLRYKTTSFAKTFLEEVIAIRRAVPFKRYNRDVGHKPGMAAGRYPKKASQGFLKLIKSAEANAQLKGMNVSSLKIIKIIANKASVPQTGGRYRQGTKRTHLDLEVKELKRKNREKKKIESKSMPLAKLEKKKVETKKEEKKEEIKEIENKKEEEKQEIKEQKAKNIRVQVEENKQDNGLLIEKQLEKKEKKEKKENKEKKEKKEEEEKQ